MIMYVVGAAIALDQIAMGVLVSGGVAVLLQWKQRLPRGKIYEHPVITLDVYATAAKAANASIPARRQIDGVDLVPFLVGADKGRPHSVLYWRLNRRTALRLDDWKLLRNPRQGKEIDWQLYDLNDDASETHNLAAERPEVFRRLQAAWRELNDQMIEPIYQP